MKTKILSLFLFAALLLAAVGCGSAQAETAETPVPAETELADVSAAPEETGSVPSEAPAAGGEGAETPAQPEPDTPTEAGPDTPAETSSGEVGAPAPAVAFVTEDLDGNIWDESCFAGHKLTMINFWEPWCGPCGAAAPLGGIRRPGLPAPGRLLHPGRRRRAGRAGAHGRALSHPALRQRI